MARPIPSWISPVGLGVDLVVLTVRPHGERDELCALAVKRGYAPFKGRWALPGGFVEADEDIERAALRELAEETGVRRRRAHLEQLGTYGAPRRDPRMRVITVGHLALAPDLPDPTAGSDAADARWRPVAELLAAGLAFDHSRILADGLERARSKLEYTALGTAFCPPEFTVAELRHVYEVVWGVPLDARNFHRKVTRTPDFLEPTGTTTRRDGGRPAQLFRRGTVSLLHPPLLRPDREV